VFPAQLAYKLAQKGKTIFGFNEARDNVMAAA